MSGFYRKVFSLCLVLVLAVALSSVLIPSAFADGVTLWDRPPSRQRRK